MFRLALATAALLGFAVTEVNSNPHVAFRNAGFVRGRAFLGGHRANFNRFNQHQNLNFNRFDFRNVNFAYHAPAFRTFANYGYAGYAGVGYQALAGAGYGDCGGAAQASYGGYRGGFQVASNGNVLLSEEVTEQRTDGTVVKTFRQFSR